MDFRPRTAIRIDRLRARVEARFPVFLKSRLVAEAERLFKRPVRKLDFMRRVDRFQRALYDSLLREYEDDTFSRLFALKLSNLAIAKFHFLNRHAVLMSAPFQITVDPSNACQLGCPACVHTLDRDYAARFDWPRSMLPVQVYDRFLDRMGPFAFCACLYNYGEPLLHKRFPDFVRLSKKYLLFTTTSTNLSMPLDDTDSIVASGLDRMILSIDGTTQPVYERYRRKGELKLVLDNVRKLASSKKKLGSAAPCLVWQFLTFEHNAHEVDDAIRLARQLGVNEILIQTPFDVDIDDPSIHAVSVRQQGRYRLDPWDGNWCSKDRRRDVEEMAPRVNELFDCSWEERFHATGNSDEEDHPGRRTCDWLYHNITIDGAARVMPCCMAPGKSFKHLVFETVAAGEEKDTNELVNSPMARLARLSFQNRKAYDIETAGLRQENQPYCATCEETPLPYGLANIAGDIRALDARRVIPKPLQWALTHWA
jgi:MoaA/NifB/PqqE/SkfB family radical SAM enzyme